MDIWIDTDSGTWGEVTPIRIIRGVMENFDEIMDGMTDAERCQYGLDNGVVMGYPDQAAFDEALHMKRVEIAEEEPPNETQETMTEGVILGLDLAQQIVRTLFGSE